MKYTRRSFLGSAVGALAAEWNESPAFRAFYNLDYDTAVEALERETRNAPDDPNPYNHLAYGILYRTLFRGNALEGAVALSPSAFLGKPKVPMETGDRERFDRALERSKNLSWDRLKKNPGQAEALYTLGVAELHRANLYFLVDKQWRAALKQAGEARRLHHEAQTKDPNLVDAMLVPSVHEYVIGSLPIYLKALTFLAGYRGDREKGMAGVKKVARQGRRTRVEARVLTALMERREKRPEQALGIWRELAGEFPGNHLYRMELVNVLGVLRRYPEGERELEQLADKRYRFLRPERLEGFRKEWAARRQA